MLNKLLLDYIEFGARKGSSVCFTFEDQPYPGMEKIIAYLEKGQKLRTVHRPGVDSYTGNRVKTRVTENDVVREDVRYYITSLTDLAEFADAARKHWSIENQLHWNLDVIFREDAARARKDNSPLNMNVLRKTALALVDKAKYGRISKKKMMFKAALNPAVLLAVLFPVNK